MHASLRFALFGSLIALGLAGCDRDDVAPLRDSNQASRGMQAMLGALSLGSPSQQARQDGAQFREGEVDLDDVDVGDVDLDHEIEIDVDVTCPGGGELNIDGHSKIDTELGDLDDYDQAYGSTNAEFSLTVSFAGCDVDGVTIDGELTYDQTLEAAATTESLEIDFEWSYRGRVEFSGAAEGSCEVDMFAKATGEGAAEDAGEWAFSGTMCGFEAAEVAADADL